MKLLIIRHADPDYSIDSLTPTGWKEAELLANRLSTLDITAFYVSPLGRAKDTASLTLKKMNRSAVQCDWLQEFAPVVLHPGKEAGGCAWDWLPTAWTEEPRYFSQTDWYHTPPMEAARVKEAYEWVTSSLDRLLASHGYERQNQHYRAVRANEDTLVFFCHFGVECVLLSRLLNIPPMLLWHGACAAPSSVTTLVTEERCKGAAYFRMTSFGDTAHLYAAGRLPSFSARFCETHARADQRHD